MSTLKKSFCDKRYKNLTKNKQENGSINNPYMFHSKTNGKLCYLSNFSNHPIFIPNDSPTILAPIRGYLFHTIEHAFQTMKYCYSSITPEAITSVIEEMQSNTDPTHAKRLGGKTAFKKRKITLNISQWQSNEETIMKELLRLKIGQHQSIKNLIVGLRGKNVYHYESVRGKSPEKLYWGAILKDGTLHGKNVLGKLWMQLSEEV
jgi:ribA/ribD-fused uncharacterized protein